MVSIIKINEDVFGEEQSNLNENND
jgi:hypothetical protein